MKKGLVALISGPSGVGKGTICKELKKSEDLNLGVTISCTTRPPRQNDGIWEVDGREYFFITEEEFKKRINEGYFAEYNINDKGYYYGTPKCEIERIKNEGKNIILEIEINGGTQLIKENFIDLSIFVVAPIDVIEKRIRGRGELPEDDVQSRIKTAKWELEHHELYQVEVDNGKDDHGLEAIANTKRLILEAIANNQD